MRKIMVPSKWEKMHDEAIKIQMGLNTKLAEQEKKLEKCEKKSKLILQTIENSYNVAGSFHVRRIRDQIKELLKELKED